MLRRSFVVKGVFDECGDGGVCHVQTKKFKRGRKMKKKLLAGLTVGLIVAFCNMPSAQALVYTDDFSGGIDPVWWNTWVSGNNLIDATDGNVVITQMHAGTNGTGISFKVPLTGDFTAQVDYALNGPIRNGERTGIGSNLGAVERLQWNASNDWQLYLTHFGDSLSGHLTTTDITGKLQMSRIGNTLSGSYWNGSGWTLLHSFVNDVNLVPVNDLSLSIWPDNYSGVNNYGTKVTFDNFYLNAPGTTNPVPVPPAILLLGSGLVSLAGVRLRRKK
jgi:hypothetical protein